MEINLISDIPDYLNETIILEVPEILRRGDLKSNQKLSIESAINNLKGIALKTGADNWSKLDVLDFGCGVKFTQTLVQFGIKIKSYVGMDVHYGIIEYLIENVKLPNFHFYNVPFYNKMYNKLGEKLTQNSSLPGPIQFFDLIVLQSVFTHFDPYDFYSMLCILRRYVKHGSKLFFTCFIDNEMEVDFFDSIPEKPLLKAFYREEFIRKLLEETGWNVLSFHEPSHQMQHHFICEPLISN